jgi:hypothetical protein
MDIRATETLAWLDANAAAVALHPGAAYAEVEILRQLVNPEPVSCCSVLGTSYRRDLQRGVPVINNRAEARSLAHKIMFAGDFGRRALTVPAGYGALLEALMQQHLADADTLGELLISAHILGHNSSAVTTARATFDAAWTALDRNDFLGNYHCILVGALLYAMAG